MKPASLLPCAGVELVRILEGNRGAASNQPISHEHQLALLIAASFFTISRSFSFPEGISLSSSQIAGGTQCRFQFDVLMPLVSVDES